MNAPPRFEHIHLQPGQKKVTVVNDPKISNCAIFYFAKEDHTLCNALRMNLLRDKDVRFAGYRMPHPLQFVAEMKVQTTSPDIKPLTLMIDSLDALETEFSTLESRFLTAVQKYKRSPKKIEEDIMELRE